MANEKDNDKQGSNGSRQMKMKELSDITGVNGPTIRYYITQGILPKPYKTHKNMAYYEESYVELIAVIKKFQKEYFLPLDVIKNAIEELGHDKVPYMINELTEKLLQAKQLDWMEPAAVNKLVKPVSRKELMEITKISKKDLDATLKMGMIIQDENKCFNVQDVKIAMMISEIRENLSDEKGFSIDFVTMHNDFIKEIVDTQFKFFLARILKGELAINDANDLAFKCIEILYRLFPVVHKRYLNMKIKESLHIE
ncbi:MAG: MerR family transcriptional regulator [Proteobacteria bacterium]|nr:MerR family transcriptional regulator [Pseudomonadota bacterium]